MNDVIQITAEPLSLDILLNAISGEGDRETGALVTFSGIVRETEGDSAISHLDYEHYTGMAEKEMAKLVERARQEWPLRRVGLIHRVGAVPVGESSVIVAVAAGHRGEAFAAARFLIDELKVSVPIWKAAPGKS